MTFHLPRPCFAGLSGVQICEQIEAGLASLTKWGLEDELRRWGMPAPPTASDVVDALFPSDKSRPFLEWSRLAPYQVSARAPPEGRRTVPQAGPHGAQSQIG